MLQQKAAPVFTVFADDACAAASAGDGEGHKRKGLVFFLELYFLCYLLHQTLYYFSNSGVAAYIRNVVLWIGKGSAAVPPPSLRMRVEGAAGNAYHTKRTNLLFHKY